LKFVYSVTLRTNKPIPFQAETKTTAIATTTPAPYLAGFAGTVSKGPDARVFFKTADTDQDGITNALEPTLGLNPNDADMDDDGVADGDEPDAFTDKDGDGLIGVLDPDSDNDGIPDGTAM